jgi:hypothetical protein
MARGALVNTQTNIVTEIVEAASDRNDAYCTGTDGVALAFVPDEFAQVGDTFNSANGVFTYLTVPPTVTPLQARMALNAAGLRSAVEVAVSAANQDVKDMWEFSDLVHRDNPQLIALASAIGLTSAQLDALFQAAAKL